MPAILFKSNNHEVFERAPEAKETPKGSVLCMLGDLRQKWYYRTEFGWVQFDGRYTSVKHQKILKTLCLMMNKSLPEFTGISDWKVIDRSY